MGWLISVTAWHATVLSFGLSNRVPMPLPATVSCTEPGEEATTSYAMSEA